MDICEIDISKMDLSGEYSNNWIIVFYKVNYESIENTNTNNNDIMIENNIDD